MSNLPPRAFDTMSDAISLSSPSGRMSSRAKKAAQERLRVALFGQTGLQRPGLPPQPSPQERMRRQAARLRDMAARGMRPRAGPREAAMLEAKAAALDAAENNGESA